MQFIVDEIAFLARYAATSDGASRKGFYVAWISPIIMFGGYGFIQQDFVALTVALLGALGYLFWAISAQSNGMILLQSIATKILQSLQETHETTERTL